MTERVYASIREALRHGELRAGELYSVVEISRTLGVSRTPVREALLRFESEGVVAFERSRGVRILTVSAHDISDLFGLRLLLEVPSARSAATSSDHVQLQRMAGAFQEMSAATEGDDETAFDQHDTIFHDAILRAAGNAQVAEAVARARAQIDSRILRTTQSRPLSEVLEVHRTIHDAILARNPEAAGAAVEAHLCDTRDILINQIMAQQSAPGA
ncbi:GntR family transcriptional regulator [Aeromicrobium sp. PE09-221]|uniref:GntR family transcriptional regulator n=1 Tax=Aeromicrobium sp. PE09-221 TaxID=1898043 RepID=UPI001F2B937E|nr:GntR family transcriptional regulator [Aeromicrobium sp. PE09-221]